MAHTQRRHLIDLRDKKERHPVCDLNHTTTGITASSLRVSWKKCCGKEVVRSRILWGNRPSYLRSFYEVCKRRIPKWLLNNFLVTSETSQNVISLAKLKQSRSTEKKCTCGLWNRCIGLTAPTNYSHTQSVTHILWIPFVTSVRKWFCLFPT